MAMLKRIAPASAFKVGLVCYGLLGLLAGVLCSLVALGSPSSHEHMPFGGVIGLLAVIVCPIVWGIFGSLTTGIAALLYNLTAGWVGGLEVEIQ